MLGLLIPFIFMQKRQPDTKLSKAFRQARFVSSQFTIKIRKTNQNVLNCYIKKKAKLYTENITTLIPIYWPICFKNTRTD